MGPKLPAVRGSEGKQAVIDRGEKYPPVGDHRSRAGREGKISAPLLLAVSDVQRHQGRQAIVGIERASIDTQTAADVGAVEIFRLGIYPPETLA